MSRWIMNLWVYILPIPLFALLGILWAHRTGSLLFTTYILAVPLIYGYVMPFFATQIYGRWRFKGKMVWGTIFVHHGFKYAASLNLFMYISTADFSPETHPGLGQYISAVICTALGYAFITWIHDIQLLKRGLLKICSESARSGKSPEEVVTQYAPLSFFLVGACFASGGAAAYELFVVRQLTSVSWITVVFCIGLVLLFTLPALAYSWSSRETGPGSGG